MCLLVDVDIMRPLIYCVGEMSWRIQYISFICWYSQSYFQDVFLVFRFVQCFGWFPNVYHFLAKCEVMFQFVPKVSSAIAVAISAKRSQKPAKA